MPRESRGLQTPMAPLLFQPCTTFQPSTTSGTWFFYRPLGPICLPSLWLLILLCNLWYSNSLIFFQSQRNHTPLKLDFSYVLNLTGYMSLQWEARDIPTDIQANGKEGKSKVPSLGHLVKTEFWISTQLPTLQWPSQALNLTIEIWRHFQLSFFS